MDSDGNTRRTGLIGKDEAERMLGLSYSSGSPSRRATTLRPLRSGLLAPSIRGSVQKGRQDSLGTC